MSKANIITAYFMDAILKNCILDGSAASGCTFTNADLRNASLQGVNITNADFSNCRLQGSVLKCIGIEKALFKGAFYDKFTIWPEYFTQKKQDVSKW
ncbi:pentapeptide repeat-containing protein [Flavitalea sp. BT771]|uniref:pentapeptide repeat-containing protein n=1 Tax=Flavitalea sp. BT771 TaxID=3063329 RepID=UPI003981F85F